MNFLDELKKQKDKLKETRTVVTRTDGQRYVEFSSDKNVQTLSPTMYGFVVDTKPDDIPVMVVKHLYIGSQDCAVDSVLNNYSIKNVLSLGINVKNNANNQKYIDCLDLPETDIKPILKECLPFIRGSVVSMENVLVHCNAGVSRAAMVVIAYLMRYESMRYRDAYKFVKDKRPATQPNAGFARQLNDMDGGSLSLI